MSRTAARHRKPPPPRKPSPLVSALQNKPVRAAAAAVAGSALVVSGWPVATHWVAEVSHAAGADQADAVGLAPAGAHRGPARQQPAAPPGLYTRQQPTTSLGAYVSQQPEIVSIAIAGRPGRHRKPEQVPAAAASPSQPRQSAQAPASSGYLNPLRAVSGLVPERVDMGVDFSGTGPVYALGDGVITFATGADSGWPGGGWVSYQLTDGPDAGLLVYVAEDVTPTVQVGQHVSSSTVIANMYAGADGIETGWALAGSMTAESQSPPAGDIGAAGPFPTLVGLSFDGLLRSVGVPAAPNAAEAGSGVLPANYPAG